MSIKSTLYINRDEAIERIKKIATLIVDKDYKGLEEAGYEADWTPDEFIEKYGNEEALDALQNIDKWTDKMIETLIDDPYYRYSLFDNYYIKSED